MNMKRWLQSAPSLRKAMPILSYPGAQLIGESVDALVHSGALQAKCMQAVAARWDTLAAVSLMDLSVEAEAFGSPVRFSEGEVPTVTAPIIGEGGDPDTLAAPRVGAGRTGEYIAAIAGAARCIDRPVFAGSIGPFSLAGRLLDISEIMVLCYEEPELVHAVLDKAAAFLAEYNGALRDAGAHGLIMAEPAAGLLSPALIAEFSTPYVRRVIQAIETDEFAVIYHNCGKTIPLIGSILETGASAFHFGNAIDIAEMLKLVPAEYTVFGNVDPAGEFRNGTPASVRAATLRILEQCAAHGNFVVSSGCDIPPSAPVENIDAFFGAVEEFYR
ncbi:MAG: uroporphyrinogen decarboxylase family protein [Oscillospiraceae bacterium]|jgi:uroporphyrinogen decarboxylase|nr:uroporphyrinogen decarboxylase family protein [Oscillospiraceae bacterium]